MSADAKLLRLVQLNRKVASEGRIGNEAAAAAADALLGELSREFRAQAERIAVLEAALMPFADKAARIEGYPEDSHPLLDFDAADIRAARRVLERQP